MSDNEFDTHGGDAMPPPPTSAGATPSRKLLVLSVVSLCLALAAGGAAGYLWLQLDDLETRTEQSLRLIYSDVNSVELDVGSLDGRVDALESDVGYVTGFDSLSDRIDDVLSALSTAERDIDRLESGSGSSFIDDLIIDEISELRECVNDYMVTVGDAGASYYTYYTC
jgi:hypothetical protein